MRKGMVFALVLALAFMAGGCRNEVRTVPEPPPQAPGETETATEGEPTVVAPLTGQVVTVPASHRAVMAMVNNAPKARPQSGLDKADIVYEVLAEGDITRFAAIYHSQAPDVIGPVRSIRPYYIELGAGFDAVMVHAGGSPDALAQLREGGYAHLDEIHNPRYFWRDASRKAPHNLYTDLTRIRRAMADKGYPDVGKLPRLPFVDDPRQDPVGVPARKVEIRYMATYRCGYEYDAARQVYKRFTQGKPHRDRTTGEQLAAVNVIVLEAKHRVLDAAGRREIDLAGPGRAYVFQRGVMQAATWKRVDGVLRVYGEDGAEIPLYPGNTWVNIVPDAPGLTASVRYE
ncbi:DUF3048 domain-containing protein [Calditerricola satsumensis]|uniref:Putative lipoprotein YerB n=1 Tax=Calditerricola satsumensis TaxID=373054 RepID=A0A8J3FBE5_9BACI|nr:DUF3048 domain-containing protein [Calditerricola satsumensis]GGK04412.1 putative lipoprotein YerB [Calditerricola satsumensis]